MGQQLPKMRKKGKPHNFCARCKSTSTVWQSICVAHCSEREFWLQIAYILGNKEEVNGWQAN